MTRLAALVVVVVGVTAMATRSVARDVASEKKQRADQNASCAGCHPDIAAEWSRSLHKQAWHDPVFQEAYKVEPLPFCRGCHAPESDPAREPTVQAQNLGVGCVSCHLEADGVHATRASGKAMHAVVADKKLGTPAFCGGCHQFDFPADANQVHPQPMQDTVAEHASSTKKDTPCQGCHMPVVDGPDGKHRSHAFTVIADAKMIQKAVTAVAQRSDDARGTHVRVRLTAAEVGHAFPTGDMFRRVEVRAVALDARGKLVATAVPIALERRFADRPRDPNGADLTFARVEAEDTRVPPPGLGSREVVLTLPRAAATARVVYTVVYQRMSTPMASAFGVEQVLDEIPVVSGELLPRLIAHAQGGSR